MPTICQILPETIRRNSGFRRKGIRPGKWKMRVEKMLQLTKMHVFNHEDLSSFSHNNNNQTNT